MKNDRKIKLKFVYKTTHSKFEGDRQKQEHCFSVKCFADSFALSHWPLGPKQQALHVLLHDGVGVDVQFYVKSQHSENSANEAEGLK